MAIQNFSNVAKEIVNASANLKDISPELVSDVSKIITILEAAGIIFIGYVVYLVINTMLSLRADKRIKEIREKVDEISKRLDNIEKTLDKKKK